MHRILSILTFGLMGSKNKKNFFSRLVDKNDTKVAVSSVLVLAMLCIGLLLLAVPIFILIIEAWYNHTITTDLNGLATYISAVAAIFATAGITKIGVQWTDRNKQVNSNDDNDNDDFADTDEIITD